MRGRDSHRARRPRLRDYRSRAACTPGHPACRRPASPRVDRVRPAKHHRPAEARRAWRDATRSTLAPRPHRAGPAAAAPAYRRHGRSTPHRHLPFPGSFRPPSRRPAGSCTSLFRPPPRTAPLGAARPSAIHSTLAGATDLRIDSSTCSEPSSSANASSGNAHRDSSDCAGRCSLVWTCTETCVLAFDLLEARDMGILLGLLLGAWQAALQRPHRRQIHKRRLGRELAPEFSPALAWRVIALAFPPKEQAHSAVPSAEPCTSTAFP